MQTKTTPEPEGPKVTPESSAYAAKPSQDFHWSIASAQTTPSAPPASHLPSPARRILPICTFLQRVENLAAAKNQSIINVHAEVELLKAHAAAFNWPCINWAQVVNDTVDILHVAGITEPLFTGPDGSRLQGGVFVAYRSEGKVAHAKFNIGAAGKMLTKIQKIHGARLVSQHPNSTQRELCLSYQFA